MNLSGGFFDTPQNQRRVKEIESISNTDPDFWNDAKKSTLLLKEKKVLEDNYFAVKEILGKFDDIEVALELYQETHDLSVQKEAAEIVSFLENKIKKLELHRLLSDHIDKNDCIVTINAGAGGTEACDWAEMVSRMLIRFGDRKGWKIDIVDELSGETAGLKNMTVEVKGDYAYGFLKSEIGVHRLVRISPFDANAKRHTSFCSVFVSPIIDDEIKIEIRDVDLKVDTYRSGGAGGQHVNKTDSAVRITHLPSGIVVQSQQQRSQVQNKEMCLKLLKSKLFDLEIEKRRKESDVVENSKLDNAFGSQIRSYVMHPYKLVKDLRTLHQSSNVSDVMDGDLEDFCYQYLAQKASGQFLGKGYQDSEEE